VLLVATGDVDPQAGTVRLLGATPVDAFEAAVVTGELSLDVDATALEAWDEQTSPVAEGLEPAP